MWQMFFSCFLAFFVAVCAKDKAVPIHLTEDTWKDMMDGEWLVKFYAPWCPACKGLAPVWERVAGWSEDLDIKVAEIDVTENPGLSGRFLVTSLPTIYHVKDGEFRQYRGARDEDELISLVDDKRWQDIEPVPWYTAPTSMHMGALSLFFQLSMSIRDMHNMMTSQFGIPVWGSYLIFAVATIIVGLLLGLVLVCCCDMMCPQKQIYSEEHMEKHPEHYIPDDEDEPDVPVDEPATETITTSTEPTPSADTGTGSPATAARRRIPKAD